MAGVDAIAETRMFKILMLLLLTVPLAGPVLAAESDTRKAFAGPERKPDMAEAERALALAEGGNPGRGKAAYEVCSACHLPTGFGRRDGAYPKLAGQHATVLIKQIADIRANVRENLGMHSFAMELRDPRDIADVAAYIETLCIPPDNGRYGQDDAAARIVEGRGIYEKDCVDCHQGKGEGKKEKFYPVLAGQHYRYLLRQMADIRDGYRQNGDPEMVKTIRKHKNDALTSIAAYLSSLVTPGTPCASPATATR